MAKNQILSNLKELVDEFNSKQREYSFIERDRKEKEITEAVKNYTTEVELEVFAELSKSDNVMLEAAKVLEFDSIRVKNQPVEGSPFSLKMIEPTKKTIDILKLHRKSANGIGANPHWHYTIEKMNILLTVQKAQDLGITPKGLKEINDSIAISRIANDIDLGKTPTSNTNMIKTLSRAIEEMLGEGYKPLTHDVRFLQSVYSKKSRQALQVATLNNRQLRGLMLEICHRIVTDGNYTVAYKQKKAKK